MTVTFFGHRDTPQEIEPKLKQLIVYLIENKNATMFYVGNHGSFDSMAAKCLKCIKRHYPHINYVVVLAYMPTNKKDSDLTDYSDTIYPDGLETTPPKYAIAKRNKWMIDKSDTVIAYVKYSLGGAAQFMQQSIKKGKTVYNLAK